MPNILFADFAYDDAGAVVVGATVNLYDRNTTTPVRATTTTDVNGYWSISHATEGRFDIEVVSGSTKRRIKYDTQAQMDTLEIANFRIRNPADTFEYDIVPAAITADRQLNLPLITATDTLACLGLSQNFSVTQYIGDTANANMTLGLTLNQGAADDHILTLKSSDVATGLSSLIPVETDDYAYFAKWSITTGGLWIRGLAAAGDARSMVLEGLSVTDDTAKSVNATGVILLSLRRHDGANANAAFTADSNLVVIRSVDNGSAAVRYIFDLEGSAHADVAWSTYEKHDDLALLADIESELLLREGEAQTQRRHALESVGIIGKDSWHMEKGGLRAMVNFTKLAMLHHGALLQVAEKLVGTERRLELMEARLAALPAGGS